MVSFHFPIDFPFFSFTILWNWNLMMFIFWLHGLTVYDIALLQCMTILANLTFFLSHVTSFYLLIRYHNIYTF